MARHAMAVYERATKAVLPEEMFEVSLCYFTFCMVTYIFPFNSDHCKICGCLSLCKVKINVYSFITYPLCIEMKSI